MSINKACQLIGFTKQAFFEAEKNQAKKLEKEDIVDTLENLKFVKEKVKKEVEIYNSKRPHTSNHMLTPNKMHLQRDLEIITWKNEDFI